MKIHVGYELIYDFPQPTPMIMVLGVHFSRASDVVVPDHLMTSPSVPISPYRDLFGNWCSRICETDRLTETAWNLFGKSPPGWARVRAICDFVHRHVAFGYEHARATK